MGKINKLSAVGVRALEQPGYYGDGGGLWLQVTRNGGKSWVFRFTLRGKSREMGLGPLHTVSLAKAREKATTCREQLLEGIDPIEAKRGQRTAQELEAAQTMTFKECASDYIKAHRVKWKNAKHAAQWERSLEVYVYPHFGDLPVAAVNTDLVEKALKPIWYEKPETASRVRGRIESVLDYATVRKKRKGDNPARLRGHLAHLLIPRGDTQKVRHHPALPYAEIAEFMAALREQEGTGARALEFTILTAGRTGEVIGAKFDEFDLDAGLWTVPAERMKADREHRVPLSDDAAQIIETMQKARLSEYVFPSPRVHKKPISNMAMLQTLKRMGRDDLTVHGFRSSFRDWCAEQTKYPREVAEAALAHIVGDKVERSYQRGDMFDKRRKMMRDWARYCLPVVSGNVVPLRGAQA